VASLAIHGRTKLGLPLRTIDSAQSHLVDTEPARGLGQDGLDDGDSLHAAGCALRAARRGIGHHRDSALAHGQRLIQQRNNTGRGCAVALRVVGAAVAYREHVDCQNSAVFAKTDLQAAFNTGTRAANAVLFLAADTHHHRGIELLG